MVSGGGVLFDAKKFKEICDILENK